MKKNKGFTLIELLVVIAIIGLLSTLAVVALNSARAKARDAKRVADVKQVQTALELYYNDANGYPGIIGGGASHVLGIDTTNCLYSLGAADRGFGATAKCKTAGATVYMGLVPEAPNPPADDTYSYSAAVESGVCGSGQDCSTYSIEFNLEGGAGSLKAGTNCATPSGIIAGACS